MNDLHSSKDEVTRNLRAWSAGDKDALDNLLPTVYSELHRQASGFMRHERADHTLQTTALIHETFLKLINQHDVDWQNRAHFFAIASKVMRRVLLDYARAMNRGKRGAGVEKVVYDETQKTSASAAKPVDILALDEALTRLEKIDEREARIVELRYFGGLSVEETGAVLNISAATVKREWSFAKAWLKQELLKTKDL